jgi:flotillin
VANVKIAGHQPVLNNAIERFLGKSRAEIMGIAKATLEGSLRGVLATLTPEQLNEDRNAFAEQLVNEVEGDMTALGLVVDTLKIQNITDDVHYLDSIGRIRNAELQSTSRVAEAIARADSIVRSAENSEQEVRAEVTAAISVAKANAEKNLVDIISRRDALVAEEKAAVAALVAQSEAEVNVQKARIDQVRSRLDADVIQPAKAGCDAAEQEAKARVAPIVEDGKARASALKSMASSWNAAGDQAREIFLLQKIEPIIDKITDTIGTAKIDKVTVIDSSLSVGSGYSPTRLLALSEQVKEVFGIDVVAKLQEMGGPRPAPVVQVVAAPAEKSSKKVEPPPKA